MRFSTRTWALALGTILLFIGLVGMAFSNLTQRRTTTKIVAYAGRDKPVASEVSGFFERGDHIVVDFRTGSGWEKLAGDITDEFPGLLLEYVIVNITDPSGGGTPFFVTLGRAPGNSSMLTMVKIELFTGASAGLDVGNLAVGNTTEEIGGVAQYSGEHKVDVFGPIVGPYPPQSEVSPPAFLSLSKRYVETSYPLTYLLPVGAILSALGVGLIAWGKRRSKRMFLPRKAR